MSPGDLVIVHIPHTYLGHDRFEGTIQKIDRIITRDNPQGYEGFFSKHSHPVKDTVIMFEACIWLPIEYCELVYEN